MAEQSYGRQEAEEKMESGDRIGTDVIGKVASL